MTTRQQTRLIIEGLLDRRRSGRTPPRLTSKRILKVIRRVYGIKDEPVFQDDTSFILSHTDHELRAIGGMYRIGDGKRLMYTGSGGAMMYKKALLNALKQPFIDNGTSIFNPNEDLAWSTSVPGQ